MCWNDTARRQRAHYGHYAVPCVAFQVEFVQKSGSGSSKVARAWDVMIQPAHEDPQNLGECKWDQKMGKIDCAICCIIRSEIMQDEIYLPRCLQNIYYSAFLSTSRLTRHHCMPPSPSPSPLSLNVCPPAITQSSPKLVGRGGEKLINPPQWRYLYSLQLINFTFKTWP